MPSALPASSAVTSAQGLAEAPEAAGATTSTVAATRRSLRTRLTLVEAAAEAKLLEPRVERARLEPRLRLGRVVATRRDIVRRVGVEERREHLDLATPDAELELAAAVEGDAFLLTALVELEQPLDRAEARGLAVEAPGRERERLDVAPGMDRRVPRDPVAVGLEHGARLRRQARVLDPRRGERLGDAPIEFRV